MRIPSISRVKPPRKFLCGSREAAVTHIRHNILNARRPRIADVNAYTRQTLVKVIKKTNKDSVKHVILSLIKQRNPIIKKTLYDVLTSSNHPKIDALLTPKFQHKFFHALFTTEDLPPLNEAHQAIFDEINLCASETPRPRLFPQLIRALKTGTQQERRLNATFALQYAHHLAPAYPGLSREIIDIIAQPEKPNIPTLSSARSYRERESSQIENKSDIPTTTSSFTWSTPSPRQL